jgi:hypothetical protein
MTRAFAYASPVKIASVRELKLISRYAKSSTSMTATAACQTVPGPSSYRALSRSGLRAPLMKSESAGSICDFLHH